MYILGVYPYKCNCGTQPKVVTRGHVKMVPTKDPMQQQEQENSTIPLSFTQVRVILYVLLCACFRFTYLQYITMMYIKLSYSCVCIACIAVYVCMHEFIFNLIIHCMNVSIYEWIFYIMIGMKYYIACMCVRSKCQRVFSCMCVCVCIACMCVCGIDLLPHHRNACMHEWIFYLNTV